jgi:hypothetical protein
MANFFKKIGRAFKSTLLKSDLFGAKINLVYRQQRTFKTYLGGFSTWIVFVLFTVYSIFLLDDLFRKNTIIFQTNSIVGDLTEDAKDHHISSGGFDFMIGLRKSELDPFSEEFLRKFEVNVYQSTSVSNTDGTFKEDFKRLELVRCTEKYPHHLQMLKSFQLQNFLCIKESDLILRGNWYSDIAKFIYIEFATCNRNSRV